MSPSVHFKTQVYGATMRDRLKKSDWLREGLRALATEGPAALKVAVIAAKLGISRGSFYWHFRDIDDFKRQLLASWRVRTTEQVMRELDARQGAPDRLKDLLRRAMGGRRSRLDQAVRAWAGADDYVARAVAANDASRIAYIASLLVGAGVPPTSALSRAMFIYWAYLGQGSVAAPRSGAISPSALDDLSALFER